MQVDYGTVLALSKLVALDPEGCVITTHVEADSPSWQAGIRTGTIVSKVNNKRVSNPREFEQAVAGVSDEVEFTLFDASAYRDVIVEPPAKPPGDLPTD